MIVRIFIFLILLSSSFVACGQAIGKKDALTDLEFLNTAVKNGHPVNYQSPGKINLDQLLADLKTLQTDSLSYRDYRTLLGTALQQIGCVHTSPAKNPLALKVKASGYFPLAAQHTNDTIYTVLQADSLSVFNGKRIVAVNGIPADSILDIVFRYCSSDGNSKAFAKAVVNRSVPAFISFACNYPAIYRIQFEDTLIEIKGSQKLATNSAPKDSLMQTRSHGENHFLATESYALLDINTFERSDKRFFRQCMKFVSESGKPLIIDLRQNTGGNRRAAVELTRYLVSEPFDYRIVRTEDLSPGIYYRGGQKIFYLLSRIKYGFGSKRSDQWKIKTYRYKPVKKNRFSGKVIVLTDGLTASSSTMVTSWLKQQSHAKFIGSQAAGGYNGNNGGAFPKIVLPASGIEIKFPAYRLVLDQASEKTDGIIPDFIVEYSLEDYLNGNDPVMEKALHIIQNSEF